MRQAIGTKEISNAAQSTQEEQWMKVAATRKGSPHQISANADKVQKSKNQYEALIEEESEEKVCSMEEEIVRAVEEED